MIAQNAESLNLTVEVVSQCTSEHVDVHIAIAGIWTLHEEATCDDISDAFAHFSELHTMFGATVLLSHELA